MEANPILSLLVFNLILPETDSDIIAWGLQEAAAVVQWLAQFACCVWVAGEGLPDKVAVQGLISISRPLEQVI